MSISAAQRWNERYRNEVRESFEQPRPLLVEYAHLLPPSGLALDIAMGLGGNAGFLLARGLHVIGVDISDIAVRAAKHQYSDLLAVIADLEYFWLPQAKFDVILNFYYLQRDLWPQYLRALKPGGTLVMETLTQEMRTIHPDIDPAYLLAPGELQKSFTNLDIQVYREGWRDSGALHPRAVASLIGKLRSDSL